MRDWLIYSLAIICVGLTMVTCTCDVRFERQPPNLVNPER